MYAKVPNELKEILIKEVKRVRRKSSLMVFPIGVLIFSSIAALALFGKFHFVIDELRDSLRGKVSDKMFWVGIVGVIVFGVSAVLILILRQMYKECRCEDYLYCQKCNAVDSDETGYCPVCTSALAEKAAFIYTTDKNEQKVIKRFGLEACVETNPSPSP